MPYLYVIRTPSGLRKIGYSTSPKRRAIELRNHNTIVERGDFTVEYERECLRRIADAEEHAHALLQNHLVKSECFRVDLETARAAVDAAVDAVEAGHQRPPPPPEPEPKPPKRPRGPIRIGFKFGDDTLVKLDYLRRREEDLPSRAEMLYRLVMRLTPD